ncbi:MAG TPA: ribose-phosphate pyrophosphokinase-like domain-containing protein, partial [Saprospiraceae bacterium]|nr:ribose-phosphate pyrophosphokinase-like domain-containing protein [Saprospiraceae bacterium]
MMKQIIFGWPGREEMTRQLILKCKAEPGLWEYRSFPDGESYIRIDSEVADKQVVVLCSMDHPDPKLIPLFLLCKTIRELDAKSITLLAPYLPYLRQD